MEIAEARKTILVYIEPPPPIPEMSPILSGASVLITIPNVNEQNPEHMWNTCQEVTLEMATPTVVADYYYNLRILDLLQLTKISHVAHILSKEEDALMYQLGLGNQPPADDEADSFYNFPRCPQGLENLIKLKPNIKNPNMEEMSPELKKSLDTMLWELYAVFSLSIRFNSLINQIREGNHQQPFKCLKFLVAYDLIPYFEQLGELLFVYFIMTMLNTTHQLQLSDLVDATLACGIHNNENAQEHSKYPTGA